MKKFVYTALVMAGMLILLTACPNAVGGGGGSRPF